MTLLKNKWGDRDVLHEELLSELKKQVPIVLEMSAHLVFLIPIFFALCRSKISTFFSVDGGSCFVHPIPVSLFLQELPHSSLIFFSQASLKASVLGLPLYTQFLGLLSVHHCPLCLPAALPALTGGS